MGDLCTKAGHWETRQKSVSLQPKEGEFLLLMLQSNSNVILTATAFRNEFQSVGF